LQRKQWNSQRPRGSEHSLVVTCQLDRQTVLAQKLERRHMPADLRLNRAERPDLPGRPAVPTPLTPGLEIVWRYR
jgi:hypothetical protein